jgi:hypothetical protein
MFQEPTYCLRIQPIQIYLMMISMLYYYFMLLNLIHFKVMPRVRRAAADAEISFIISLPASPGNRIRASVPTRAAPAEDTAPR